MSECLSCKEDRKKQGLPPMERLKLPVEVTDSRNFRKPVIPTYVCPHCDGDSLVASALKNFAARED